jgi:hypothetical protein
MYHSPQHSPSIKSCCSVLTARLKGYRQTDMRLAVLSPALQCGSLPYTTMLDDDFPCDLIEPKISDGGMVGWCGSSHYAYGTRCKGWPRNACHSFAIRISNPIFLAVINIKTNACPLSNLQPPISPLPAHIRTNLHRPRRPSPPSSIHPRNTFQRPLNNPRWPYLPRLPTRRQHRPQPPNRRIQYHNQHQHAVPKPGLE